MRGMDLFFAEAGIGECFQVGGLRVGIIEGLRLGLVDLAGLGETRPQDYYCWYPWGPIGGTLGVGLVEAPAWKPWG